MTAHSTGVQQVQGARTLPLGALSLFLLTLLVPGYFALTTSATVLDIMVQKGWPAALKTDTFYLDCLLLSTACSQAFSQGFQNLFPMLSLIAPAAGLVAYGALARPRTYSVKDPGQARWAQATDEGLQSYFSPDPKRPGNKLLGYMGHLLHVDDSGKINYRRVAPLYLRMSALSENVLVVGGVGAGKTRGYYRPLIMLAAHLGFTVIVFDLKYPQPDSGLFDMIGYWVKRGRRVQMFTPFASNSMRLPLLDSVTDYASALSMATTIMPPPEYSPEAGKHYRDRDRGVLAAFILHVARSDTPNFGELLRLAQFTPKEMTKWFDREVERDETSEVVLNLKGVFGQGTKEVATILQGIKNALRVFYNPRLARATESLAGENLEVAAAFREPTLLYVGIQQEWMMEGDGVVLLQLTKRYIDRELMREAERQGGRLRIHAAYVLDEFPSFGQLPYMMRSLGVMRSYNVSTHIGLQNLSQLAVVYGENYSQALTTSVIGRKIFFPRAIDDEEREVFSRFTGNTTVYDIGETDSRRRFMGSDLHESTRQGLSVRKVAQPLLPPEEFAHFREMEAVAKVRGAHPIRMIMPAIEDQYVEGEGIPANVPNGLNELYRKVNPNGENMADFTRRVIASGRLGTEISPSDSARERKEQAFRDWVNVALKEGALWRFGRRAERTYLRVMDLDEVDRSEGLLAGFHSRGWIGEVRGEDVFLREEGKALLGREVWNQIEERAVLGTLDVWLSLSGPVIEGHPEREAMPEDERRPVEGVDKGGQVLLRLMTCRELFGSSPSRNLNRVGQQQFVSISRSNPGDFLAALAETRRAMLNTPDASETSEERESPGEEAPGIPDANRPHGNSYEREDTDVLDLAGPAESADFDAVSVLQRARVR